MSRIDQAGISIDLPRGWEGVISGGVGARAQAVGALAEPLPVILHAATFPLPPQRGDFGDGAIDGMRRQDIFIALFEYGDGAAGRALFQQQGLSLPLAASDLAPLQMPRPLPGMAGCQRFFHSGTRAFSLAVVIGSFLDRKLLVAEVNRVLASLTID